MSVPGRRVPGRPAAIGLLWLGTIPLTTGLIAQIFGPAHLGALFGVVFLSHQVGSFFGAWAGGRLFDLTGTYDAAWTMTVLLGLLAALLHWPIRDEPVASHPGAGPQTAG